MTGWTDSEIVDELCDVESGLNGWEVEFVEDMSRRLNAGETLTDPMRAKAEQILKERDA